MRLWKILPIVTLLVLAVLLGIAYLMEPAPEVPDELTGILRAGDSDYDWYSKYVELRNPLVKMGKNFAGKRMVMFSGIIENNGEKTLDVVEVKLIFFNADVPVWEIIRIPIRPGARHRTPPIEPLEQRGFTLYVEQLPENWQASNAEMAISGFRFLRPVR
ncbi:MAG: hypothetical protein HY645_07870 [Acidobacteria bacterium]|nr:hypothetical protein [Acidobacteriota bacterium]